MFWTDIILVIVFAMILASLLVWGLGWRHPAQREAVGGSILFLLLVLVLTMWAGGIWLNPWYADGESAWLAILGVGVLVSLVMLAVAVPARRKPRSPSRAREGESEAAAMAAAFGMFFWVLIIGMMIAIFTGYMF
jgi:hypothetical protein